LCYNKLVILIFVIICENNGVFIIMFEKVDTIVLFTHTNRYYFTKLDTSFGCVIMTKDEKIFMTDFRYEGYAKKNLLETASRRLIWTFFVNQKDLCIYVLLGSQSYVRRIVFRVFFSY